MQPWTIAVFLYNTKNEVQTETFPEVEKQKHGEEKSCMLYELQGGFVSGLTTHSLHGLVVRVVRPQGREI